MASTKLNNPRLDQMTNDYLYHLNVCVDDTKNAKDLQKQFGDVKFICMGGTGKRALMLAKYLRDNLKLENVPNGDLINLTESGHRYVVYKIGPVLCCSHGVGSSSMSVLLHELLKLVKYAKCKDPIFIRVGTSGGIGVDVGTVIVTKDAYNGQARLDGASCDYQQEDKFKFLDECCANGIKNFEMEAAMFSSLMLHVGVKAAELCVTFVDRLKGDQYSRENYNCCYHFKILLCRQHGFASMNTA
uniref:Nucleoside phosphorylase domain-containing protein n=1 Tax=Glossina brevipalpis TaxID=37001 RepID=A0A1A9X3Y4_9MUSC